MGSFPSLLQDTSVAASSTSNIETQSAGDCVALGKCYRMLPDGVVHQRV